MRNSILAQEQIQSRAFSQQDHVPNHIHFSKKYMVKMFRCSMQWNKKHESEIFTAFHGASGVQKRKNWFWNVHIRASEKTQALKYAEEYL